MLKHKPIVIFALNKWVLLVRHIWHKEKPIPVFICPTAAVGHVVFVEVWTLSDTALRVQYKQIFLFAEALPQQP